jgi:ubiquitin-protein ligase
MFIGFFSPAKKSFAFKVFLLKILFPRNYPEKPVAPPSGHQDFTARQRPSP